MKNFQPNDRVVRKFPNGDVVRGKVVSSKTMYKDTVAVVWDNTEKHWPAGYITSIYEIEKDNTKPNH